MSLSAEQAGFSRNPSGKTPPPAPSEAFAKRFVPSVWTLLFFSSIPFRARELQGDSMIGRYRPPALRALASGGSPPNDISPSPATPADGSGLPPNSFPAGFRRARAGTLPSNVSLAAQQYAATNTLGSTIPSTESFSEQLQHQAQNT